MSEPTKEQIKVCIWKDRMANRSDRIIALGNGQVPKVAATAGRLLSQRFND